MKRSFRAVLAPLSRGSARKGEAKVAHPLSAGPLGGIGFVKAAFDKANSEETKVHLGTTFFKAIHVLVESGVIENLANIRLASLES